MIPVKALVAMGTMGMGVAGMAGVGYLSTTPLALTHRPAAPSATVRVESVTVLEPERATSVDTPTEISLKPVMIQTAPRMLHRRAPFAVPAQEIRMQPCSGWVNMETGPAHRQVRQLCAMRVPVEPGS
jgi:hypothetical protein